MHLRPEFIECDELILDFEDQFIARIQRVNDVFVALFGHVSSLQW